MSTNVEIPALGESITEAVIAQWHKAEGEQVAVDEPLCELETDKANVDLPSPAAGLLRQLKEAGATVRVGEAIGQIDENGPPPVPKARPERSLAEPVAHERSSAGEERTHVVESAVKRKDAPPRKRAATPSRSVSEEPITGEASGTSPTGEADGTRPVKTAPRQEDKASRRVPMSKIRRRIAERLVRARETTAMLTTFNEIDMTAVLDLRTHHKAKFAETHGVPLGLMSFFARACAVALGQFPALNAEIEGDNVIYHEHVHLGLAVSTDRGLVVPVLRHVEAMSLAHVEAEIKRVAKAARDGKLGLEELSGGTFTITNGGVFGSLLSTPILNPPQTGILGMHAIQKRPVVINDRIRARPLMYVALTYDHRLVDGKDSVLFLVRIKELLEDPTRMLLEI